MPTDVEMTVHATADGPPLEPGATVPLGPVHVRVHHRGQRNDPEVFANVIDIGQMGDVTVLSAQAAPTGILLTPLQTAALRRAAASTSSGPTAW